MEIAQRMGVLISCKMTPDRTEAPYEINTTWWRALNGDGDAESLDVKVRRYLASRSIGLVIPGVPGIHIHGALGSSNDYRAVEASGVKRDVNRSVIDVRDVEAALEDPASRISLLRTHGTAIFFLETSGEIIARWVTFN